MRCTGRTDDRADRETRIHGVDDRGHGGAGRAEYQQPDGTNLRAAERLDDVGRVRTRVDLDDRHRSVDPHGCAPPGGASPDGLRRERRREDRDRSDGRGGNADRRSCSDHRHRHPDDEDGEFAEADRAERQRSTDACDPVEEPEPECAGTVEQDGDPSAEDPGDGPGGQPPHHQRASERTGHQIGGQGRQGHGPQRRDEHRRHRALRTGGDREPLPEPARTGEAASDARCEDDDAERRRHGETETERVHEERVDDEETAHG